MAKAKREVLKPKGKTVKAKEGKASPKINLPPRPKDGSRKAEVFDTYFGEGYEAAIKLATDKGLAPGTARSWMSGWSKIAGTTIPKAEGTGERKERAPREKIERKPKEKKGDEAPPVWRPDYRFETERKARIEADHKCNRSGMDHRAMFVHQDEVTKKWGIIPLHLNPEIPMPVFKNGDHITNLGIKNSRATVIGAGPEQSVIRYVKDIPGRHREPCVGNRYLMLMPPPEGKEKKKGTASRERL